jgi:hypothetical protein
MKLVGKTKEQVAQETKEKLAANIRNERDNKIKNILWRKERYYDELVLNKTPTEQIEPILNYIQELRDITSQEGFPEVISWPNEPQGI